MWRLIRNFDSPELWNPGTENVVLRTENTNEIGQTRVLYIHDGSEFKETLLAHSDTEMSYTYNIVSCPLPIENYVAKVSLIPVTNKRHTLITWQGSFDCKKSILEEMRNYFGSRAYDEGIAGINVYLNSDMNS